MKLDDEFIFFFGEVSSLEIRSEVVYPSEPATLAASKQTYKHKVRRKTKRKLNRVPKIVEKQSATEYVYRCYLLLWGENANSLRRERGCNR